MVHMSVGFEHNQGCNTSKTNILTYNCRTLFSTAAQISNARTISSFKLHLHSPQKGRAAFRQWGIPKDGLRLERYGPGIPIWFQTPFPIK